MLSPDQILAFVTATGAAVDIFDKISGQIKSVLVKGPKEKEGDEERWRHKVHGDVDKLIVSQDKRVIQTITSAELAKLSTGDLSLVKAYENKMGQYYRFWLKVYESKDTSTDPLVNAKVDQQLIDLINKMKGELTGIVTFLERIGLRLDDHYTNVRYLVENFDKVK